MHSFQSCNKNMMSSVHAVSTVLGFLVYIHSCKQSLIQACLEANFLLFSTLTMLTNI